MARWSSRHNAWRPEDPRVFDKDVRKEEGTRTSRRSQRVAKYIDLCFHVFFFGEKDRSLLETPGSLCLLVHNYSHPVSLAKHE